MDANKFWDAVKTAIGWLATFVIVAMVWVHFLKPLAVHHGWFPKDSAVERPQDDDGEDRKTKSAAVSQSPAAASTRRRAECPEGFTWLEDKQTCHKRTCKLPPKPSPTARADYERCGWWH